jgi:hypothetical protein
MRAAAVRPADIQGTRFAETAGMAVVTQLKQYATRRLTRRLVRTMPWIGSVIAVATVGSAMRRKGILRGALDTALDFIPFVGSAKNLAEIGRGRDFIPDKPAPPV